MALKNFLSLAFGVAITICAGPGYAQTSGAAVAHAGDVYGLYACTLDGKNFVVVEVGDKIAAGNGRVQSNAGQVGVKWGQKAKVTWGQVSVAAPKRYTWAAGAEQLVFHKFRDPKDDTDALTPYVEITRKGKAYRCGAEAG